MALTETTGLTSESRLAAIEAALIGDGQVGVDKLNNVYIFTAAGAPSNGVTQAGVAGIGSMYIDITAGKIYINTGTKASPTWTVVGAQTA